MNPDLERRYRNRASLPPAERRAVEAEYNRALAEYEAKWRGEKKPVAAAPESRTEGAPSGDMPLEGEAGAEKPKAGKKARTLPRDNGPGMGEDYRAGTSEINTQNARDERDVEAFRRDAETESDAYREGYTSPQPGSDSWDAQGRNLDRSRGMSERDVEHSDRQRKYRQGAYDQMGRGQMNPQQPLDLGSAEDQEQWDKWVRGDRQRQARYNPAAEAARQAAEDEKRYGRIATEYSPAESLEVRAADMNGTVHIPMTPQQKAKNDYRRNLEVAARHQGAGSQVVMGPDGKPIEIPVSKARAELQEMDHRQSEKNKAFRQQARDGGLAAKNAEAEHAAAMEAARMKDPRYAAWRNQMMLAGGQATGGPRGTKAVANALQALPEAQRQSALRYMVPGGQLSAEVDARQLDAAAKLAGNAITGALVNAPQAGVAAAQARGAQAQAQAQVDEARRPNEDVVAQRYAKSGYFGYDEFTPQEQQLAYNDFIALGYTQAEAQAAVRRIAVERRATQHADLSQPSGK